MPPRAIAGLESLALGYGIEVENEEDGILRVAGQPQGYPDARSLMMSETPPSGEPRPGR